MRRSFSGLANNMAPSKRLVLVCFAVKEEARYFRADEGVEVIITGMGRKNAAKAIKNYKGNPRLVISAGFAGGLNPQLPAESVVFSSLQTAPGLERRHIKTIDRVCITRAEKARLYAETGADAVDMESEALGAECAAGGIPFCVLKVISDSATEDMPLDFNEFITPNMKMNMPKLIGHVLLHPGKIPELIKFQKRVACSGKVLAEALKRFIEAVESQPAVS